MFTNFNEFLNESFQMNEAKTGPKLYTKIRTAIIDADKNMMKEFGIKTDEQLYSNQEFQEIYVKTLFDVLGGLVATETIQNNANKFEMDFAKRKMDRVNTFMKLAGFYGTVDMKVSGLKLNPQYFVGKQVRKSTYNLDKIVQFLMSVEEKVKEKLKIYSSMDLIMKPELQKRYAMLLKSYIDDSKLYHVEDALAQDEELFIEKLKHNNLKTVNTFFALANYYQNPKYKAELVKNYKLNPTMFLNPENFE